MQISDFRFRISESAKRGAEGHVRAKTSTATNRLTALADVTVRAPVAGFRLWFLLLSVCCLLPVFAEPSFTAQLEPDSVAAGEQATLKLIFTDLGNVDPPSLPALANCPAQFAGSGTQISIVNFSKSSSIIHQYVLQPQATGTVDIPPITVDVGGKKFTSNPLKLRVGQGFDQRRQIGFLKLVVPKTDFYVGETVPVEIRYYFKVAPAKQGTPRLKMEGFTKGKDSADSLPPETIEGEVHSVYRYSLAVTAAKAGELDLGPAEFDTLYMFRSNRRRSLFDDPFFGGGGEQRQITFNSDPVKIRVSPPPRVNQPSGFAGAVGRFQLDSVTVSPTNVAVGDPITVRLSVRGRGNFGSLALPEFPADAGFQSYPGTNSFSETDVLGMEGVKQFEQVLVPERAGAQMLRLPSFVAWNPEAKRYDVLEPRKIPVNVRAGMTAQALPQGNVPAPVTDPAGVTRAAPVAGAIPLKTQRGLPTAFSPVLVQRPWFISLLALPPLAWFTLGLARRLRELQRRRGPDVRAQRERLVSEGLANLSVLAQAGRAPEFFAALNGALQEQLALTLGGTAGTFTEDVVTGRLVPRGLAADDAAKLQGLFAALAAARYSPDVAQTELAALSESARQVIGALRTLEGKR